MITMLFPRSRQVVREMVLAWVVALCLSGLAAAAGGQVASGSSRAYELTGDYRGTHDPSIMKEGGTYYVFATGADYAPLTITPSSAGDNVAPANGVATEPAGTPPRRGVVVGQLPIRCSHDLQEWKKCGHVFDQIPEWIKAASPATKELWAPDISYFDGLYHLYYAYSSFGVNTSGIALATNKTLDSSSPAYKWLDQGVSLKSTQQDDFNAIDPNLILDEKGQTWLAFGSFWSGIKMRRIERQTGKPSAGDPKVYSLATRARPGSSPPAKPGLPPDWEAIEAPFILRHNSYFYLFVSWDLCCKGKNSTYRTMVGRAKHVTGPYVDKEGKDMEQGGGSLLLAGNGKWVGPGGESLLHVEGGDLIVFHAYNAQTGRPSLHISSVGWKNGWPTASLEGDDQ